MSNSGRWRRLLEWIRHMEETDNTDDITYTSLMDEINSIKKGSEST